MKKILFKGCGTAISTPFDENGVNLKEFEKLVEDQIQNKEILYDITAFTTEKNTLNLIINQLFKEDNTLFIDAYFLNTTENTTFENLENFNISVCDTNNKEVLNKTFKSVVIPKGLPPQHGRRILFPIENEFFNLQEKDLSKLSYKFTFDYN